MQCGYFDLVVDTSEVNLAVRYTVTVTVPSSSNISDIKIVGYSFPGQTNNITYLQNNSNTVSSSAAANISTSTMRIYISWNDDTQTESMNDIQDTQVALNSGKGVVQASVLFEQLVN